VPHLIDLGPLRRHRDYRLLYLGQAASFVGSMLTIVALPYQMYQLTHSSLAVGMISSVELVALLGSALWGGAFADAFDRRRLLIGSELLLLLGSLTLAWNATRAQPSVWLLYVVAALMSAWNGFHRPALEAITPRLVDREELPAIAALGGLRGSLGAIGGPALAGILLSRLGPTWTYLIDAVTFVVSILALSQLRALSTGQLLPGDGEEAAERPSLRSIWNGLSYAAGRPELVGTYVVDLIANMFAMPMALYPALAERYGGARAIGWLYAGMSIGSLTITLFSRWTGGVRRHGLAVIIAAALWGVAIAGLGYAPNLAVAVLCLAAAGAADMVSGIFRMTIWNQTIPTKLRGRLAGVEMISYMTGPLLGNARAGWVATVTSLRTAIVSGGLLCAVGVAACALLLPRFRDYRAGASGESKGE
jgi:MFS family permease